MSHSADVGDRASAGQQSRRVWMGHVPWPSQALGVLPLLIGGALSALAAYRFASDQYSARDERTSTAAILGLAVALQCTALLGGCCCSFVPVSQGRKRTAFVYSAVIVTLLLAGAGVGCCLLLRDSHTEGYRQHFSELLVKIRDGDRSSVDALIRYQEWQRCCGMWNHTDWTASSNAHSRRADPFVDGLRSCTQIAQQLQVPPVAVNGCFSQLAARHRAIACTLVAVGVLGALLQAVLTQQARKYMVW